MKSTGEVLGLGKTLDEALFKGITAAGMTLRRPGAVRDVGVLVSVDTHDQLEIVSLAKKLDDLGFKLYATWETAASIRSLGIDVEQVGDIGESDQAFRLLESGALSFVVYTGALMRCV